MAAVDAKVGSGHEGAALGQEEDGRSLEVLGGAEALEQSTAHPGGLDVRLGLQKLVGHGGADILLTDVLDVDG